MKLTKNLFEDVVAYIFAEPGAMGAAGSIECLKSNGESFIFFYIDEETNCRKQKNVLMESMVVSLMGLILKRSIKRVFYLLVEMMRL